MSFFDISLLFIIGAFGLFGLWFGLIHTIGSLVGTLAGIYVAGRLYEPIGSWLINISGWGENFSRVLVFVVIFMIVARLFGLLFWVIEKTLAIITKLPIISSLNRLLGLLLGLIEGVVVVGISLYFVARFPITDALTIAMEESRFAPILTAPISILLPLVPDAVRYLESQVSSIF